jgi:hypothetical protein
MYSKSSTLKAIRVPHFRQNAIAHAILGEWEGGVITLWMVAAEDEIDELLEHNALGSLPVWWDRVQPR